jgi:hypothetical protein
MLETVYANRAVASSVEAVGFRNRLKAGFFAVVPLEVLSAPDLSPAAKTVWAVLSRFQGTNGASWPKISTIAAYGGLSISGTKKAIRELKAKGFLIHSCGERNMFILQVPIRTTEDFCRRIGHPELIAEVKSGPQSAEPRARKAGKTYPEANKKSAEHSQINAEQDGKNGAGIQTDTGGCPGVYLQGAQAGTKEYPGVHHQGAQTGPRDEASAQTRTAKAEPEEKYLRDLREEIFEDNKEEKGEKSLKSLAPNGEESKTEENFQLGEEEKVGLETKSPSADPDTSKTKASEGNPPAVLVDSSLSAGTPASSSVTEGIILDPETGKATNYADLPPWARSLLAGLLHLRSERDRLVALLSEARGAEKVMIQARIRDIEEELAYSEERLRALLAEEAGQTAGAAEPLVT